MCFSVTASALQQCSTELSDQRELEEYKENMAWKEQANQGFHEWWESMQTSVKNPDEKRVCGIITVGYTAKVISR